MDGGMIVRKREEIPVSSTWNMADILPSDERWEELYEETEQSVIQYEDYRGHLGDSAQNLWDALQFDEKISYKIETLYVYGKQRSDENTKDSRYQQMAARAQALSYKAAGLSSWMIPEILGMDENLLESFRKELSQLSRYDRTFQIILAKKAHTLSAEMEELLAASMEATQSPAQIFNLFNNADIRFEPVTDRAGRELPVTHGTYISLMEHEDRQVRKAAFESLYKSYGQFSNTLAAVLDANVKQAAYYAKARKYPSSRAYYLAENEIPETVYDQLIEAVHQELLLLHEYVAIRKKALNLEEIHMYDLYAPLVADSSRSIPFEEGKTMVLEALAPLGEEYVSLLSQGFDNRWIDVYENEGKRSGAYSWGVYGVHPYVLLNYNDNLNSVFTLAHEMGHALHSWYSNHSQSYADAGYKIFVAEVASTCNEAFLIRYLLNTTEDKKEKAYLLNHFMESFRGTLFRQTMFAEFEREIHRRSQAGEALTAQLLQELYHGLNEKYFGPEMVVDRQIDFEWSRIPHFYTPFYVYQYATGFSAAIAISSRILAGDREVLEGYFQFLKGGNSMPPIDLLKLCKVDMSTSLPVKEALGVFKQTLEEFKNL